MLKQISAALLAASLLTAPALAAEGKSTSTTPATNSSASVKTPDSTSVKPSNKSVSAKPGNAMNAKAQATTTPPTAATPAKPAVKKVRHSMHHRRHHHSTVGSNIAKSPKMASIKHIPSSKSATKVQPSKS
jgi:hypothetical protein